MNAVVTCPSWCVSDHCNTDHWAEPGSRRWPAVKATGWPGHDTPDMTAFPTWGEIDGLAPAVALYLEGERIDHTIDMTPDQARQLAAHLVRAADAVERG